MVVTALWLPLIAACAAASVPQDDAKPDPNQAVERALTEALGRSALKARFTGRVEIPNSDPIDLSGTALLSGKDLLFIEYHASGGQVKFIVRKGDTVLEWHPVAEMWVDAQQLGDGAAGRGVQNPHEVFRTLLANRVAAEFRGAAEVRLVLDGPKLQPLLRDLVDEQRVRWPDTEADSTLSLDAEGKLQSVRIDARIGWEEDGLIRYRGRVNLEDPAGETEYRFFEKDADGKPRKEIPLDEDARRALGMIQ